MKLIISAIMNLFILFAVYSDLVAGEFAYTCKVMHVYDIDNDSSLRISTWDKQFKGSEFSVSRVNGQIIGEVVPTVLARSTKVIHRGNKEYSFKAFADFGKQVQLLEVKEFVQGEQKPFVAMSMGGAGIVSGICK